MHKKLLLAGLVAALTGWASGAGALSLSMADLYYPSFQQARHLDQSFEFLGAQGDVYDGVAFAANGGMLDLTVHTTVGQIWGTGDYEWLSVWIDWDLSHSWDVSERVVYLQDQWFDYGTQAQNFAIPIPVSADLDETWMRVRFTFDGQHGAWDDLYTGEVEDYLLGGTPPPIPEPNSLALIAASTLMLAAAGWIRRRRC